MNVNYAALIADHDEIERLAHDVLYATRGPDPNISDISFRLQQLSMTISEHLSIENMVSEALDETGLKAGWGSRWSEGKASFRIIERDGSTFLSDWSADMIARDFDAFATEAEAMLATIAARIQRESAELYAVGLQHGVITLHASEPT